MTTINQRKLSWGIEVGSVLGEAGLTVADLARELGVNRATAHRYLSGEHCPKAATIERVSNAVAVLVAPAMHLDRMPNEPGDDKAQRARQDIVAYLFAIAAFEFGGVDDAADRGLRLGLNFVGAYLDHAAVEQIQAVLARHTRQEIARKVPRSKRRAMKLGVRLLFEVRRIAFDIARARYPASSRFDRIAAIFESEDPSLKGKLTPNAGALPILVYEHFHTSIAEVLARHVSDPNTRLSIHDGIDRATRGLINELNQKILPTLNLGEKT